MTNTIFDTGFFFACHIYQNDVINHVVSKSARHDEKDALFSQNVAMQTQTIPNTYFEKQLKRIGF